MIGSMTTKLFKQHNFPEPQRFYLKQQHQHNIQQELSILEETLKPKLKITIVTETWSPEINGVANSLLQLCKGLQKLGASHSAHPPNPKNHMYRLSGRAGVFGLGKEHS
jgi:hypothetical protein